MFTPKPSTHAADQFHGFKHGDGPWDKHTGDLMISNKNNTVPFNRCYWVVPGKLMAGCYPGAVDEVELHQKLKCLLDHGIRHVMSLMEPSERGHNGELFIPYEPVMASIAKIEGLDISFSRMPIRDLGVPSVEEMFAILDHIDQKINTNMPVYLHCWGGRGRTGTVVGCYLIRHGYSSEKKVLQIIQELRRKVVDFRRSPETAHQMDMVVSWVKGQ